MKTKCDSCSLATPILCLWFSEGKVDAGMRIKNGRVIDCSRYVPGNLPELETLEIGVRSSLDADCRLTRSIKSQFKGESLCYLVGV